MARKRVSAMPEVTRVRDDLLIPVVDTSEQPDNAGKHIKASNLWESFYNTRWSGATTSNAWTELYENGTIGDRYVIATDTSEEFMVQVVGRDATTGDTNSYKIEGTVKNTNDVNIIINQTITVVTEEDSSWDVSMSVSGAYLTLLVKGDATNTVSWTGGLHRSVASVVNVVTVPNYVSTLGDYRKDYTLAEDLSAGTVVELTSAGEVQGIVGERLPIVGNIFSHQEAFADDRRDRFAFYHAPTKRTFVCHYYKPSTVANDVHQALYRFKGVLPDMLDYKPNEEDTIFYDYVLPIWVDSDRLVAIEGIYDDRTGYIYVTYRSHDAINHAYNTHIALLHIDDNGNFTVLDDTAYSSRSNGIAGAANYSELGALKYDSDKNMMLFLENEAWNDGESTMYRTKLVSLTTATSATTATTVTGNELLINNFLDLNIDKGRFNMAQVLGTDLWLLVESRTTGIDTFGVFGSDTQLFTMDASGAFVSMDTSYFIPGDTNSKETTITGSVTANEYIDEDIFTINDVSIPGKVDADGDPIYEMCVNASWVSDAFRYIDYSGELESSKYITITSSVSGGGLSDGAFDVNSYNQTLICEWEGYGTLDHYNRDTGYITGIYLQYGGLDTMGFFTMHPDQDNQQMVIDIHHDGYWTNFNSDFPINITYNEYYDIYYINCQDNYTGGSVGKFIKPYGIYPIPQDKIGVLQETGTAGEVKPVMLMGGISNIHTGLTQGVGIYIQPDGMAGEKVSEYKLGNAVSSTETLLVNNKVQVMYE